MVSAGGIHQVTNSIASGLAAALVKQAEARRAANIQLRVERGDLAAVRALRRELAASLAREAALQQQLAEAQHAALRATALLRRQRSAA